MLAARLVAICSKLLPPVCASLRSLPRKEMLGLKVRNMSVAFSLASLLITFALSHVTKLETLIDLL